MKHIYFLFFLLCSLGHQAFAQTVQDTCGTPDPTQQEFETYKWYGDTLFLDRYYDSLVLAHNTGHYSRTTVGGVEPVWLRIPIQFWVYTDGTVPPPGNTRLPNQADFQRLVDNVNDGFRSNNIPVRFYMLCPQVINDPDAITINNLTEGFSLIINRKTPNAVNIHICENTDNKYIPVADGILIRRSTFLPPPAFNPNRRLPASSITHEIGHYFGLQHTFFGSKIPCQREPVSRGYVWRPFCPQNLFPKTCAVTGDFLSDTEADHEDIPETDIDNNCVYSGNREDFYGSQFRPNGRNYMSYHPQTCRSLFTPQQRSVMLNNMFGKRIQEVFNGSWNQNTAFAQFDRWEPDNADITARVLPLDESQTHSMQGTGCNGDTEDWFRFRIPPTGPLSSYIIEVADISNLPNPIATIGVFLGGGALDGNFVATAAIPATEITNANGVRQVAIFCNDLEARRGQTILIRLASANGALGQYRVTLESSKASLTGSSSICGGASSQFVVTGLLPNSTVTWRTSSSGVLTLPSNATGAAITVTAGSSAGQTTLIATITDNGCTYEVDRLVSVDAASLDVGSYESYVCEFANIQFRATLFNVLPSSLKWYVKSSSSTNFVYQSIYDGQTDIEVNARRYGTVRAYARGTDQCGGQTLQSSTTSVTVDRCGSFALYPNPADNYVEISAETTESRGVSNSNPVATPQSPLRVELYNAQGRQLQVRQTSTGTVRLDTSRLPRGLYHVTITHGTHTERQNLSIER